MKKGDLVRRKSDPVHTGQVVAVSITGQAVTLLWLNRGERRIAEYLVPISELEYAEEWK